MYGYDELKRRNNPEGERLPDGLSEVGELWVSDGNSTSNAVAAGGLVYTGFESGDIKALDSETGDEVWSYSTEYSQSVSNSPAVADGSVYVGGDRGAFYAFDASTGETEWEASLDKEIATPPVIDGDSIYIGTMEGVQELSVSDGSVNWTSDTNSPVRMSPVVMEDMVIFGSGSDLYSLNRFTGAREWNEEAGGLLQEIVGDDTRIYVLTGTARAFFRDTGDRRWGKAIAGSPSGSPAIYDGSMYIGTDTGNIQSLNLDDSGVQEWISEVGGEIRGSPLVVDGVLYTVSAEGPRSETATLHAIDPETGDSLGKRSIDYDVNEGPTVAYGNAYVSTKSGVYGYGGKSGPTASFDVEPTNPSVGNTVSFDASSSSMGGAPIESYRWEFNSNSDSSEWSGVSIERTFDSEKELEVSLKVTDKSGLSDTTRVQVSVTKAQQRAEGNQASQSSNENEGHQEGQSEEENARESGSDEDEEYTEDSQDPSTTVSETGAIAAAGAGAVALGGLVILTYRKMSSGGGSQRSTCPECGAVVRDNSEFCVSCGTEL